MSKKEAKCYRTDCEEEARYMIHWAKYVSMRRVEPACRKHALIVQQQCPQAGTLTPL